MNNDKKLKTIVFILLVLLLAVFIVRVCPILLQNDTLYDIKLGERYLNTGMFNIDDYSFHQGLVYQTHHYIPCLVTYLVYQFFSFTGLYVLEVILLSIICLLFYFLNKTMMKNNFLIYIALFFQLIALSPFISLRAQMYSYIIFLLEILMLEKYLNTSNRKYLFMLTLLPLVLINVHSGVIYFYFIIMFTYLLDGINLNLKILSNDKRMDKKHVKALITSSLIGGLLTIINPYGLKGITYGLKTLNSYYISGYITEFQPFNVLTSMGLLIILYMGICVISLILSRRKVKIHEVLLLAGTIFMSLLSTRHFSLLIVTSVVIFPHIEDAYRRIDANSWSLTKSLKKGITPMNVIITTFYIMMIVYFTSYIVTMDKNPLPNYQYPVEATKYIKDNLPSQARIFNQYEWGSYLMFNDIKVYIDPRCDLYNTEYNEGTTVMKDYIDTLYNHQNLDYIASKYDIDYFLLNKYYPIVTRILESTEYTTIYNDNLAVIIKVVK